MYGGTGAEPLPPTSFSICGVALLYAWLALAPMLTRDSQYPGGRKLVDFAMSRHRRHQFTVRPLLVVRAFFRFPPAQSAQTALEITLLHRTRTSIAVQA